MVREWEEEKKNEREKEQILILNNITMAIPNLLLFVCAGFFPSPQERRYSAPLVFFWYLLSIFFQLKPRPFVSWCGPCVAFSYQGPFGLIIQIYQSLGFASRVGPSLTFYFTFYSSSAPGYSMFHTAKHFFHQGPFALANLSAPLHHVLLLTSHYNSRVCLICIKIQDITEQVG